MYLQQFSNKVKNSFNIIDRKLLNDILVGIAMFSVASCARQAGNYEIDGGTLSLSSRGCLLSGVWQNNDRPETEPVVFTVLGLDSQNNTLASARLACSPALRGSKAQCAYGNWAAPGTVKPFGNHGIACSNIKSYRVIDGRAN